MAELADTAAAVDPHKLTHVLLACGHLEERDFAHRRCMLMLLPFGCGTMRMTAWENFQRTVRCYKCETARVAALEALWVALNHPDFERVGYAPTIHEAMKRLRDLEKA
jgi:hypothetical protein